VEKGIITKEGFLEMRKIIDLALYSKGSIGSGKTLRG